MYIIFSFLIIILIGAFIYLYINVFNKIYKENVTIKTGNYSLKIMDTYLVNTDYKNKKITDDYLVVVKMNIKDITGKNKVFETANMYLKINDVNYYPTNKYSNDLIDLGADYKEQKLSYEDKSYLFVFEIPESQINKKMMLYYSENGSYKIKLSPSKLKKGETKKSNLNNDMVINGGSFDNYKINISSYEISGRMKLSYRFCALSNKCMTSYEYIVPSLADNYDKVILKINSNTERLADFIERYGTIKYTVNNEEKQMTNTIKRVNTNKVKTSKIYYFEINRDISSATNISLVFTIRNNEYEYVLK